MRAFKLIRRYPYQNAVDNLLSGVTFDNGITVMQFPCPTPFLGVFKSFKAFKKAYKRLFEPEQRTELVEVEV